VGSLILILPVDLPAAFLVFFWGVGVATILRFPAWVFDALALAPADWVETRILGIGMSPSNPGIGEIKLSKAYIQIHQELDLKKKILN
jgi:hypothetical protein